jgi:NAD(P)-dependent dehydrogenase (short-subunit alcohol dehydrogenase family)
MLLQNKIAVIYGAGGGIGSVVAKTFAREGARLFLAGRTLTAVQALADEIARTGGAAEAAAVDALDENAANAYLDDVLTKAGRIDISFCSISIPQQGVQGVPLLQIPVEDFMKPIVAYSKSYFITARAAARRMMQQKSGVILAHVPEVSRLGAPLVGGMASSWASMEAMNRNFSGELAQYGIRAVTIRSTGLPETKTIETVFGLHAKAIGIPQQQFQGFIESLTHTKRSTTVQEVADAAAFAASDRATSMTASTVNLTGGLVVDW